MTDILLEHILQPLRAFIDNDDYKEISITKPAQLDIETIKGNWLRFHNEKLSLEYLYGLARLLAVNEGKSFSQSNPVLDATIDSKHRVNVVYGKQTNDNIDMTIRLKRNSSISLDCFTINQKDKEKIISLVKNKKNILISGGAGTGKTSLINSLIRYIPKTERLITLENVREIKIDQSYKHSALIYLSNDTKKIGELINSCLRMRPDRILIGELRIENSWFFPRIANSGHDGTIATIHASSTKGAIDALIDNIKTGTSNSHDEASLRKQLLNNIDAIIQLSRSYVDEKMLVKATLEEINHNHLTLM